MLDTEWSNLHASFLQKKKKQKVPFLKRQVNKKMPFKSYLRKKGYSASLASEARASEVT